MKRRNDDDRELVRRALRASGGDTEPEVAGLIDAVPAMLREARRRRTVRPDPLLAAGAMAQRWLPRLAVATAALLLVAVLLGDASANGTPANGTQSVDRFLLTGDPDAAASDPMLRAFLADELDDG